MSRRSGGKTFDNDGDGNGRYESDRVGNETATARVNGVRIEVRSQVSGCRETYHESAIKRNKALRVNGNRYLITSPFNSCQVFAV